MTGESAGDLVGGEYVGVNPAGQQYPRPTRKGVEEPLEDDRSMTSLGEVLS